MRLSEAVICAVAEKSAITIRKDGEFSSLGLVSHQTPAMLVFLEHARHLPALLRNSHIACVVTTDQLADIVPANYGVAISACPRQTFYDIHDHLARKTDFYGIAYATHIEDSAEIARTAYVADSNVRVGKRVRIEPNVTIHERVVIDDDVIIRAGSVIGAEGFAFNLIGCSIIPILHAGGVRLHSRVEVQSNCCIDKSVFGGFTEIGEDTKLDNFVQIAHNVKIGRRCRLGAGAMLAGSVTIGDDVFVGPKASVSTEVRVGHCATLSIGSVVTKEVAPGARVSGNFAIEHAKFIEFIKKIR